MTHKLFTRISILALVFMLAALPAAANEAPSVANVQTDAAGVYFQPQVSYGQLVLTVTGPRDFQHRAAFNASESPVFGLGVDLADGTYNYELRVIPAIDQETHELLSAARETGDEGVVRQLIDAGAIPETTLVQSGSFTIAGGLVANSGLLENVDTKAIPTKATVLATNDGVIRNSLCVGTDCPNSPSFGFDTLRLQENNTRFNFDDTSTGSFPANDWRLTANDSSNGGDSYLSIDDATAGRQVFRVDAGAPANSLRVASSGNIGVGKSNPVVNIHVVEGDSPTLRLEQDGSSGFTPQTYDIVSNEANFFIRDVTNGSKLFFRAKPGAPEDSLFIAANGDIGMGTDSPSAPMHVLLGGSAFSANASTAGVIQNNASATDGVIFSLIGGNGSSGNSQVAFGDTDNEFAGRIVYDHGTSDQFRLFTNGAVSMTLGNAASANLITMSNGATLTQAGVWANASSRALKHDIHQLSSKAAEEVLRSLEPVTYRYNAQPDEDYVGFIAEDVPGLVATADRKGLAAMDIVAVLTKVVQQQQRTIDDLSERLGAIEQPVD